MPTDLGNLIDTMATTSVGFMTDVITTYWVWILGLVVLVALGSRFKRLVSLAR